MSAADMKKLILLTVFLITLILLTGPGCNGPNGSDSMVTVQGMVIDAGNQVGISGATVAAGVYSATTDSSGEYKLTMSPGDSIFRIVASGYKTQSQRIMVKADKTTILNYGLIDRFHTTGIIEGTVADSKTVDFIEGAILVFTGNGQTYQAESIYLGAYAIELPTDFSSGKMTYSVAVTAPGYQDYSGLITVSNGSYQIQNILMKH